MFKKVFGPYGEILKGASDPIPPTSYPIQLLQESSLAKPDETVRHEEGKFAPVYDKQNFATPGMREMARQDTTIFKGWIGNPSGLKILEIGHGTGRMTLPLAITIGTGQVYAIDTAQEYLNILRQKAALGGVNPRSLRLGMADVQSIDYKTLSQFTEGLVDRVVIWFGPLALMPTNPQYALNICAKLLKPGGHMLLSTNSRDGLAYTEPEKAIAAGKDPKTPLGYTPSIFTRRDFEKGEPNGMVLGNGTKLPAHFYQLRELVEMIEAAGLHTLETAGITRLTGLFPVNTDNLAAIEKFINLVAKHEPSTAAAMRRQSQKTWKIAVNCDKAKTTDLKVIDEYTYLAYYAMKPFTPTQQQPRQHH